MNRCAHVEEPVSVSGAVGAVVMSGLADVSIDLSSFPEVKHVVLGYDSGEA